MDVDWKAAVRGWKGLNLSALYRAEDIHNRSFALISSIISQRLLEALPPDTSTVVGTALQKTTAIIAGSASHQTQDAYVGTQQFGSTTSANPVSWQTAFWTLAAIALNTCLQDCGRVCAIQREFALLVRSSPFICLADTLVILLQLFFFALTEGPKNAIQIVSLSRNQHPSRTTPEEYGPAPYVARGILATLAVIQSIKLFALSGIPWSQFFGACYLSSYFVNAVINVFGRSRSEIGGIDIPRRGSVIFDGKIIRQAASLAAIAQLIAWTISLTRTLPDDVIWSWGTCGDILHVIALLYGMAPILMIFSTIFLLFAFADVATILGPAGIFLYFCSISLRREWPSFIDLAASVIDVTDDTAAMGIGIILLFISFTLHVCFYPFSVLGIIMNPLTNYHGSGIFWIFEKWDPYGLVLVFISISAFLSHLVTRVFLFGTLATRLHLRHLSVASHMGSACLFLFTANVAFALIYFTVAYDSDNTNKPRWADNLGRFLL